MIWRYEKVFTKQHFEKIACLCKNSNAKTKYEFVQDMAKLFSEDNPKFKPQKFFMKSGLLLENEKI
jgi:hypothetical protein